MAKQNVLLSFDDGPAPEDALGSILQVLRNNNIKAEFYVLGKEVETYANAALNIAQQGHALQNHTWNHPNLTNESLSTIMHELESTQNIISEITGTVPTRIRPPYGAGGWPGRFDEDLSTAANELSLEILNWDIDTNDWRRPQGIGPDKLDDIRRQIDRARGKAVLNILMHVLPGTANDLQDFINFLKDLDCEFISPIVTPDVKEGVHSKSPVFEE